MTASRRPSRSASSAARRSRPVSSRSTSADITAAEMRGKTAQVTVRFVSQLISVTRDQGRRRDRRQSRQGDRRHRRLDLRARCRPRAIRTGSWSPPKPGNERMGLPRFCIASGVALSLTGAAMTAHAAAGAVRLPGAQVEALRFSDLNGWAGEDHAAAFQSFHKSCKVIRAGAASAREARPVTAALYEICGRAVTVAKEGALGRGAARGSLKQISTRFASLRPASRTDFSPVITRR